MPNTLFKKVLLSDEWNSNKQVIEDASFIKTGFTYIIGPSESDREIFARAKIMASDIEEAGSIEFSSYDSESETELPDITVYISKIEAVNGDGEVILNAYLEHDLELLDAYFDENGTYYPVTGSVYKKVIVNVPQLDTSDATANAGDILSGKTAYIDGVKVTGNISSKEAQTYTPGAADQTIAANQYLTGVQTIKGDSDLYPYNIKSGVQIFNIEGSFTSDATANATDILSGKTAYVNGSKITGSINSKAAQTYTPGTADQTISKGQFLSGVQTILGDPNLVPENIKKDISVFGVAGTLDPEGPAASVEQMEFTLYASGWSNGSQTISNAFFIENGYTYLVNPKPSSYIDYINNGIYADDMDTDGYFSFNCIGTPSSDISVLIIKMPI